MLDWHLCQICNPLEIKLFFIIIITPLVPGISFGFLRRSVYWKFGNLHAHRMERNWK